MVRLPAGPSGLAGSCESANLQRGALAVTMTESPQGRWVSGVSATVQWGNAAEWFGGLSTAGALVFAGLQVRSLHTQTMRDRRVEAEGVAASWRPVIAPKSADAEGWAVWHYEITVNNPGRLPIRDVEVEMTWPCSVTRVHPDYTADEPRRVLHLHTPVIAGGAVRHWDRYLRMKFEERHLLPQTEATVRFSTLDNEHHATRWGGERRALSRFVG